MNWFELPQEYKDLIDNLSDQEKEKINFKPDHIRITSRFIFDLTDQGDSFWFQCHCATDVSKLPKID